jgi:hypothetical protein
MSFKFFIKQLLPYGLVSHVIKKKSELRMLSEKPSPEEPPVYNSKGESIKVVYLQDDHNKNWPYSFVDGRFSSHVFWDRNNYGLNNHVYSHRDILSTKSNPVKKFALFIESETIVPDDYKIFASHAGLDKDFNLIFTHSNKLLDTYENSVFIPAGGIWYGTQKHGGIINQEQNKFKIKNVSIVSSDKIQTELHKLRFDLAKHYKNDNFVDSFGTFDGGAWCTVADYLEKYRYSIVVENAISPYFFTEKILNCFAAMTVPIYIGATAIDNYFNTDGIIQVRKPDIESIDKIIKLCGKDDYINRLPAITDNFKRVQDYLCIEDYIYNHYKQNFI